MIVKSPILPQRVRKVPKSFGWIDHRLVRDGHIRQCSPAAAALYLFLACVGDRQGLSYYGDASICGHLALDGPDLERARSELVRNGLLAWKRPLYQVLSLEPATEKRSTAEGPVSLGDVLKKAAEATR
jgi:hypothetical protein